MTQIPIINGIYTDANSDFRTSYPLNLVPVPKDNGISQGYLRPAEGVDLFASGQDIDRGGINWDGLMYRVSGSKLIRVNDDGTIDIIGDVGNDNTLVTFDYSFDYLAIASNNNLFLYDGVTLTQVTDGDLGVVFDMVWVDGYFMTTDGAYLIVTELNDPFAVSPLKYGSAEISPDPIVALLKLRNEVYAINRYTIEVFSNVGGDTFPFQRVNGALIERGAVGGKACTVFMDSIAFVGSSQKEAIGVYLGVNGQSPKISTREIEKILSAYTGEQLSALNIEARAVDSHNFLYIHLPDKTLVFDGAASLIMGQPIWFVLKTNGKYQLRNFVYCYSDWYCGDASSNKIGKLTNAHSSYYGASVAWEFATQIAYNESKGVIIHELELIALTGNASSENATISTSYSIDGVTWSVEKSRAAGNAGQRNKRLTWFNQGFFRNWRIQRFKGDSNSHLSFARLEAKVEGLEA